MNNKNNYLHIQKILKNRIKQIPRIIILVKRKILIFKIKQ